jgi:hypothetical protein
MPMHAREKEVLPPVFVNIKPCDCTKCGEKIEPGALFTYDGRTPICTKCSGIADLAVLRSGMAELTRLAGSYSKRKFAILIWQEAYQQWRRTGLLAEPKAIQKAARQLQDKLTNAYETQVLAGDAILLNPPIAKRNEPIGTDAEADAYPSLPHPAQVWPR